MQINLSESLDIKICEYIKLLELKFDLSIYHIVHTHNKFINLSHKNGANPMIKH